MPLTFAETPLYYRDSQGQYHRVLSGADMTAYRTAAEQDAIDANMAKADEVGIVITGKRPSMAVTAGQYVIVRNSTISGKADGLYTAAKAIPANTAIDATYLTAVSNGGLNDLQNDLQIYAKSSGSISLTPASGFSLVSGWGSLSFFWRGNVGFLYASGLRSSSRITTDTVFASGLPYLAKYFLHAFPIIGSTDVGRVIANGTKILINGIPANTDIFFGFSFPLQI